MTEFKDRNYAYTCQNCLDNKRITNEISYMIIIHQPPQLFAFKMKDHHYLPYINGRHNFITDLLHFHGHVYFKNNSHHNWFKLHIKWKIISKKTNWFYEKYALDLQPFIWYIILHFHHHTFMAISSFNFEPTQ